MVHFCTGHDSDVNYFSARLDHERFTLYLCRLENCLIYRLYLQYVYASDTPELSNRPSKDVVLNTARGHA